MDRAWAVIDLDNIVYNYRRVQELAGGGGRQIFAVVKADAYGHGAVPVARALERAGANRFAVATPQEALQLRRHGIGGRILLLGMADADAVPELARQGIDLTVCSRESALQYAAALNRYGLAAAIHIKADSGMGRLGICAEDAAAPGEIAAIADIPCFRLEGMFTHFAVADEDGGQAFTREQFDRFAALADRLAARGQDIPLLHCANSAAILSKDYTYMDGVRPGVMLYGINPCGPLCVGGRQAELRPAMSLFARVAQVKRVDAGQGISYGQEWQARRDSVIATLSIGYADGLMRRMGSRLSFLINGQPAPQVGRLCMDMCMVDATDIHGIEPGDCALIFGRDDTGEIPVEDVAAAGDTIPYEVYCAVGRRVARHYVQGSDTVKTCYVDQL